MTLEQAERAVEILHAAGHHEAEVYPDYSGRGMYGRTTPAVVCDCLLAAGMALGQAGLDPSDRLRQGTMGRGWVVY